MVARASPRNGAQPNVHQMSTKLRAAPALRAALLWGCLRAPHAPNAWPAKKLKEMQKLRWRRHPSPAGSSLLLRQKLGARLGPVPVCKCASALNRYHVRLLWRGPLRPTAARVV